MKRFHQLRTPSQSAPTGFLPPLVPERNIVGDKSDSRRWQSPAFAEAVACPALHRANGGRVDVPPAGLLPGTAGHYTRQKCIKIYWNLAAKGRITYTHTHTVEFCTGAVKVPQDSELMARFSHAVLPEARVTAVVIPQDCEYSVLVVPRHAATSLQVAAIGLLTTPLSTSWRFETHHDEQDTGTAVTRISGTGNHDVNTAMGCAGPRRQRGLTTVGAGRQRRESCSSGSDILIPCKTLTHTNTTV